MINKIIDGISKAIFAEFGAGYEIYTESIEQGYILSTVLLVEYGSGET